MKFKYLGLLLIALDQRCLANLTWDIVRDRLHIQLSGCAIPARLTANVASGVFNVLSGQVVAAIDCLGGQFNKTVLTYLNKALVDNQALEAQVKTATQAASDALDSLIQRAQFSSVAGGSFQDYISLRLIPSDGDKADADNIYELLIIAKETVVALAKTLIQDIEHIPASLQNSTTILSDLSENAASTIRGVILSYKPLMDYASNTYTLKTQIIECVNWLHAADQSIQPTVLPKEQYTALQSLAQQYDSVFASAAI